MRSLRYLPVVLLALPSAGCGGGGPAAAAPSRRAEAVQEADRLYRDDRTEVDSARVVINDPETLRLWWLRATADTPEPKPEMPSVDFQNHSVLMVAAGRRNAGDRIRVDSIGFEIRPQPGGGGRDEVWFAIVRTIPDCNPFPGTSYPLEFVRVPKVGADMEFVDRVVSCPGDAEGAGRPAPPDPFVPAPPGAPAR
jgi:hypothetical protein